MSIELRGIMHPGAAGGDGDASGGSKRSSFAALDVGHARLNVETEVYMTPKLQHRLYVRAGAGEGDGGHRESSGKSADKRGGGDGEVVLNAGYVPPPLTLLTSSCYSVGHFMNDATASCWFSYLLLYLEQARGLDGLESGVVLFSGQVADAIATPLVGIASDMSGGIPCLRLGRRKTWNFMGALLVVAAFLFVFGYCLPCLVVGGDASSAAKTASFAIFASLFNVGWAAVQVSHMAMVPELTLDESERVMLNSARYAFTVLANVYVFAVMWLILHYYDGGNEDNKYRPEVYTLLTYCVLAGGGLLSLAFLTGTHEEVATTPVAPARDGGPAYASLPAPAATEEVSDGGVVAVMDKDDVGGEPLVPEVAITSGSVNRPSLSLGGSRPDTMAWRDWLRMVDFYKVAAVYMFARLATNVSQVYLTFFITETLNMDQTAIAIVPLIVYLSSLVATFVMKLIDRRLGRRNSMTMGGAMFCGACLTMMFIQPNASGVIYGAAIFLGAGSAITMVISVSMEADLVGRNVESAAFLYGAISLTDKLSNGFAVLGIQLVGQDIVDDGKRANFIRYVNGCIPAVAMGLGVLVAWTIKFPRHLQGTKHQGPGVEGEGEQAALLSGPVAPVKRTGSGSEGGGHGHPHPRTFLTRVRSFFRSEPRLDTLAERQGALPGEEVGADDLSDHLLGGDAGGPGGGGALASLMPPSPHAGVPGGDGVSLNGSVTGPASSSGLGLSDSPVPPAVPWPPSGTIHRASTTAAAVRGRKR